MPQGLLYLFSAHSLSNAIVVIILSWIFHSIGGIGIGVVVVVVVVIVVVVVVVLVRVLKM